MGNKKRKLTTFQTWVVIIGLGSLILTSAGFLIRNQLLDPGEGGSPIYIPTDPAYPVFDVPEISLDSINIKDLDESHFKFEVYIKNSGGVTSFNIRFYVDGESSHIDSLGTPTAGYYIKNFYKSDFSGVETDSVITIDLDMYYKNPYDPYQRTYEVIKQDVVDGFSFIYTLDDPTYIEPAIIEDSITNNFNLDTERISFSFLVSDFELVNSIYYHFVVDNNVVQDPAGNTISIEMDVDSNGKFSTSFDYTQFDLTKENFVYLVMNFENEDGDNEDRKYDKFFPFQYGEPTTPPTPTPTPTPTNGTGINYIYAIIATLVALTIIKKIKRRQINNAKVH